MEIRHITVTRHARYYLSQSKKEGIESLWFLIHGYGQLAYYFLRQFSSCFHPSVLFVAPEALSRFYLDSKFSRIGASWMTREDRLREIEDVNTYLTTLFHEICGQLAQISFIGILGFSQGVPVVWRWLRASGIQPNLLLLWAGVPPLEPPPPLLRQIPVHYVYGINDPFISKDVLHHIQCAFNAFQLSVQFHSFEGGHMIHIPLFQEIWLGALAGSSQ